MYYISCLPCSFQSSQLQATAAEENESLCLNIHFAAWTVQRLLKACKRHSVSQVWEVTLAGERVLWEVPDASKPRAVVPSLSSAYWPEWAPSFPSNTGTRAGCPKGASWPNRIILQRFALTGVTKGATCFLLKDWGSHRLTRKGHSIVADICPWGWPLG